MCSSGLSPAVADPGAMVSSDPSAAQSGPEAEARLLLNAAHCVSLLTLLHRLPNEHGLPRQTGCAMQACCQYQSRPRTAAGGVPWAACRSRSTGSASCCAMLSPACRPCKPRHVLLCAQTQGLGADKPLLVQVQSDTDRMRQLEQGLNAKLQPQLLQLQAQTARLADLRSEQAQAEQHCASLKRCTAALAQARVCCMCQVRSCIHRDALQEVKLKRQQLEAATALAGDPNHVAKLQGAVQVLTKDAARMALHLGLLQYQLRQHDLHGAGLPVGLAC